jgi:AraC-like DNA-binding protein
MEGEDRILRWLKPYVRHCGNPTRPPWRLGTRRIPDYLLHAVRDGEGVFTLDGVDYEVEAGDLFWVPPNTDHELRGTSDAMSCPYVHFDLVYRGRDSQYLFNVPAGIRDLSPYGRMVHPPLPAGNPFDRLKGRVRTPLNGRVIELIVAICNEAARSQPYARWKTSGLMFEILCELLRGVEGVPESYIAHLPVLEKAVAFVREHVADALSVSAVARFTGISVPELRALFVQHYGCSPRAFIRRARIEKAKELLIEYEDLNVTEAAELVGFSCIHSFTRAFKQIEGVPPTAFRRFGTPHVHSEMRGQLRGHTDIHIEEHAAIKRRMLALQRKR